MLRATLSLALAALLTTTSAKEIPSNVQAFYDAHMNSTNNVLAGPFNAYYGNSARTTSYVTPSTGPSVLFLSHQNGGYADMDIDCDGENASEGLCTNDPTGQSITAFQSTVEGYNAGIRDLDAHIHSYVVLGNSGGDITFHPQSAAGIRPLSVVAVVCNDQLHYGVWGDTNGGTTVGEASLAMGQLCFGDDAVSGDNGHEGTDVLYIAFPGMEAVPGAGGASWAAGSKEEFESSIEGLGDSLVAQL